MKRPWQCVLQQMIFSHVKISYFLRVFKYDFSQWPKTLMSYVYIIKYNIIFKQYKSIKLKEDNTTHSFGYCIWLFAQRIIHQSSLKKYQ